MHKQTVGSCCRQDLANPDLDSCLESIAELPTLCELRCLWVINALMQKVLLTLVALGLRLALSPKSGSSLGFPDCLQCFDSLCRQGISECVTAALEFTWHWKPHQQAGAQSCCILSDTDYN